MSTTSTSPLANALMEAFWSSARNTIASSLAGVPHHLGSRTTVTVCAVRSMRPTLNGPAVLRMRLSHPRLNSSGLLLVSTG